MRKKRIPALFLAAVMLFSLSGCGAVMDTSLFQKWKASRLEETAEPYWAEHTENRTFGESAYLVRYEHPFSYMLEYPETGNDAVDQAILKIVEGKKQSFEQEYKHDFPETQGLTSFIKSFSPKYGASMILSSETYVADDNILSVVFFETHEKKQADAPYTEITTHHFLLDEGKEIPAEDLIWRDFRENASAYAEKYFANIEPYASEPKEQYLPYLAPDKGLFDRFALTEDGILFYFDAGELFPASFGLISMVIPYEKMEPKTPEPQAGGAVPNMAGIDPNRPMVALTYDDGPHPVHTNAILDVLEQNHVPATFFDLGKLVKAHPEVVQREEALGCEVASHSYDHKNFNKLTDAEIRQDMQMTEEAFRSALGRAPHMFRPPYGNCSSHVQSILPMPIVLWSVDTVDWKSRNADAVMQEVLKEEPLDGKVILMHGIYESSAQATAKLVPYLKEKGYQLVTVSQLIEAKHGETPQNGKIYNYLFFQ